MKLVMSALPPTHFQLGAPFSLFGRRSTDDSRAHRTITSLAVTLILTLFASLDSSWYDSTSTPRWSSFQAGQLSEPSAPAQHPHQHQRQVDQQQRCEFQTTHATRCNVKLVTAAQQLHGILDNTANNKVLECELRLYALQTILYDNITHVSPHVAPPPSLDIVAYRDPGTTSCTTSSHLNSNANITATPAAAPDSALAAAAGVAAAFAHAVFATSAVAAAFTSARTPATLAAVPVAQHTACASAYAAAPAAFLLTAACVAAAAFVPDVVARAAVRTAVLAAAALTAVPAAQPTARVDARASASVAVPAASQLKTSYSYFDIATSLQGCSDEIALTFMGSVTSHSFIISTSRAPSSAHHLRPLSEL